jgi:hypothetical protein
MGLLPALVPLQGDILVGYLGQDWLTINHINLLYWVGHRLLWSLGSFAVFLSFLKIKGTRIRKWGKKRSLLDPLKCHSW